MGPAAGQNVFEKIQIFGPARNQTPDRPTRNLVSLYHVYSFRIKATV